MGYHLKTLNLRHDRPLWAFSGSHFFIAIYPNDEKISAFFGRFKIPGVAYMHHIVCSLRQNDLQPQAAAMIHKTLKFRPIFYITFLKIRGSPEDTDTYVSI